MVPSFFLSPFFSPCLLHKRTHPATTFPRTHTHCLQSWLHEYFQTLVQTHVVSLQRVCYFFLFFVSFSIILRLSRPHLWRKVAFFFFFLRNRFFSTGSGLLHHLFLHQLFFLLFPLFFPIHLFSNKVMSKDFDHNIAISEFFSSPGNHSCISHIYP